MDARILIERLIAFAKVKLNLEPLDEIYVRNALLGRFLLASPAPEEVDVSDIPAMAVPDALIEETARAGIEAGLCTEESAERFAVSVFGMLTPRPSDVNRKFESLRAQDPQAACDWLYRLSVDNFYIQKTAVDRNLKWEAPDGNKKLEITINLSKPEKDNKDIAKLLTLKKEASKYPECLLCKENEGYAGTMTHPARGNLRTASVTLNGQAWFMQYSPYAYYDEHIIAVNKEHTPMRVDGASIAKLLDFVDFLPNYFIGSNAALPIVGGSILNHEHFQGGRHLMPMQHAKVKARFVWKKYSDVEVGILDWYTSAVRLESASRAEIAAAASEIVEFWNTFDDPGSEIVSRTGDTRHNAVAPIVRKTGERYIFDLILRNNRCDECYPDGIFHAHPEYHNIKKEGIGLIEAMGLFILPGRLKRQLRTIETILTREARYDPSALSDPAHDLYVHRDMIANLVRRYPNALSETDAHAAVIDAVDSACRGVLSNVAVFKREERFGAFMERLGCIAR